MIGKSKKKLVVVKKKTPMKKVSSMKLARDVSILKKKVKSQRPEVKTTDITPSSVVTGQVKVNLTGAECIDISPSIGTGNANGGRIGNQCLAIGNFLRIQLRQQSAGAIATRYIVDVWKTDDVNLTTGSTGTFLPFVYNADTISSVIDYNSSRNMIYRGIYKRVFTKKVTLSADQTSSVNTTKDLKVLIKDNQIMQWPDTVGSAPMNVRWFLTVRADSGNASTATASTLPLIAQTAINTGAVMSYCVKCYYVDS